MENNSNTVQSPPGNPLVAVLMGSKSDWDVMRHCPETLSQFGIPHECRVLSAHRAPAALVEYIHQAEARGVQIIIGAAGGAAHLPGVAAAHTTLPVLGVPMLGSSLGGMDSLFAIVQMPAGVPVGTLAIGKAGAINAALLAVSMLSLSRPELREHWRRYRKEQTEAAMKTQLP
jgi:5-(carboxyamino)imidazole ribonucleotide mutase